MFKVFAYDFDTCINTTLALMNRVINEAMLVVILSLAVDLLGLGQVGRVVSGQRKLTQGKLCFNC